MVKFTFYTGLGQTEKGEEITNICNRIEAIEEAFKRLHLNYTKWAAHGNWKTINEPILIYQFLDISEDVAGLIHDLLKKIFEQESILVTREDYTPLGDKSNG